MAEDAGPVTLFFPDLAATEAFAAVLARGLEKGDFVGLSGDLGTGKTVIARQVVRTISGIADEDVASPTFNLVLVYAYPRMTIWHFDLYRIRAPEETFELGVEDALAEGLALVEWPERLGPYLPEDRLDIALDFADGGRRAVLSASGTGAIRLATLPVEPWTIG